MEGGIDDTLRRADADRWASSRFIADPAARGDILAIYAFDHELVRAMQVASNPLVAEIRLTWWREALDEIEAGGPVRAHPVAQALAVAVRGRGLSRELLEAMIEARIKGLDRQRLDAAEAVGWAEAVGGSAAVLAARVLDPAADVAAAEPAGAVWALSKLAGSPLIDPQALKALITERLPGAARAARGLSVAAFPAVAHGALARGILGPRPPGPVGRQARLLWAAATGRI